MQKAAERRSPPACRSRAATLLDAQLFLMSGENRVDDYEQSLTIAAAEVLRFAESFEE